jgi:hypothetical protein
MIGFLVLGNMGDYEKKMRILRKRTYSMECVEGNKRKTEGTQKDHMLYKILV